MEEKKKSLPRFIGVFLTPVQTMKSIVEDPKCLIAVLFAAICSAVPTMLNLDLTLDLLIKQMEQMGQIQDLGMTQAQLSAMMTSQLAISMISTIMLIPIMWFGYTILLNILVHMFKGESSAKQLRGIVGNAMYIKGVFSILTAVIIKIGRNLSFGDVFSVYGLVGSMTLDASVIIILSLISIPRIWEYGVTAVGIQEMSGLSRGKCIAIMVIVFVLLAVVMTGVAFVSQTMMGTAGMVQ